MPSAARTAEATSAGWVTGLPQFGAQSRDQGLQGIAGVTRRFVGPELLGQRGRRHDTPGAQGEQDEQQAQLTPADMNGTASLVPHQKRPEQPDPQRVRHPSSPVVGICARLGTRASGPFNTSYRPTLPVRL
jgi:hypothetical protein